MGELIRLLGRSDWPAAMRLKDSAGWNQRAQDWESVLDLTPNGCFCLEYDGAIVATATILPYATELAWVGMVLTAPAYRGRGFARLVLNRTLDFAQTQGIRR